MKSFSILSAKTLGQLDQLETALHAVEKEASIRGVGVNVGFPQLS